MDSNKKPGRPLNLDNDNKREKLIETAARMFGYKGFDGVSLKEISQEANVTPAMVSYYFENKAGLLKAVMELMISMLQELLEKICEESEDGRIVDSFAENYLEFMTEHRWVVPLIGLEILSKDSESRRLFLEKLGPKVLTMLSPKVQEEMDNSILRSDLSPDFVQISLFGMTIIPFLAAPILSPLFGHKLDKEFAEKYSDHIKTMFLEGATTKR